MQARPLQFVAEACAAAIHYGSPAEVVGRVCTDSRQAQPGDLFFALRGERFDAHAFLPDVIRRGVTAAVVEPRHVPQTDPGVALLGTDNTRAALGRLAARYRDDFEVRVITVAGSNGKTTTKELLSAVLSRRFNTLASPASFNNDIGVPLTLLALEPAHQALVVEIGTNHPGELAPLARMAQPSWGVITSIGREHLEYFGDLAAVAAEEGSSAELLPSSGTLFLNGDSPWTAQIAARTRARVCTVGLGLHNQWRVGGFVPDSTGISFSLTTPAAEYAGDWRVAMLGRHQALNAAFAVAVGAEAGIPAPEIRQALLQCRGPKMRMQVCHLNGLTVINDCYNANADSMLAALQTLEDYPCAGRKVAVLGDMAELGDHAAEAHLEVGRRAARAGLGLLVAVGRWAEQTARGATQAGFNAINTFSDMDSALAQVPGLCRPPDVVLLKASRAASFERLVEALQHR